MDDIDEFIEKLILAGLMEVSAIDSRTGEFLYSFTDKLKDVDPGLFYALQDAISNELLLLWASGFLNIRLDGENIMVSLTDLCDDPEALDKLSPREQDFLLFVISKFDDYEQY